VEEAFFMIGKTLRHYQITGRLGKGGMGEVYRAKDQKLGRDVAIKLLPEEFAKDADRVARFQREAKLLASLNHPNIAAIHGLEESGGTDFLVLELVDGETLADRIKAGPIPVEESLKLALQIAEALEAAHEKGVIHRDLKPANIKVTPDGKVKVLDFGLAKAFAGDREEVNLSNSPTLSNAATQQGVILGTAAYMSPEQAKGKNVDKRTDVWAFGCVLFEMLTGREAFSGKDITDILAAVIRAEPEWANLPANLHWRLRELLGRCLEKEVKNRCHDIADVRIDIQKALGDSSGALQQPATAVMPRTNLYKMLPWIVSVLGIIIAGVIVWNLRKPEPRQAIRFDYEIPKDQRASITDLIYPVLAVSPDGKQFVYSTSKGLYLRSVDRLTAKIIAGTEGNTQQPSFSPDGKSISYYSPTDGKLKKIAINGGEPMPLCDTSRPLGISWDSDDAIVYGTNDGIMRISASGGTAESLIKCESGEFGFPHMLPDGESMLYTATDASGSHSKIMVQLLRSGKSKELFPGSGARYLPTGHIVYAGENSSSLYARPFDPDRLEFSGKSVPVVESVLRMSASQFAVSDSGTLVYLPVLTLESAPGRTLVWVDKNGREESIDAEPRLYRHPNISPDRNRVALSIGTVGKFDIWIWDLVHKNLAKLTSDSSDNMFPIWTPDGRRIVFASPRDGHFSVYWKSADGVGEVEKLGSVPGRLTFPLSWSKDGKNLITMEVDSVDNYDIGMLSMDGNHRRKLLLHKNFSESQAKISPDGLWMAYKSNESGGNEVYICPFPDAGRERWQISTNGGHSPLWSPDGRELFYRNEDSVLAVAMETKPTFSRGTPKTLFSGKYVNPGTIEGTPWDINPDGKRFLMMKESGSATSAGEGPPKINIVLNWLEELKQRVPKK
jgi:eukaryotic-like serine/threonine-protein kinase